MSGVSVLGVERRPGAEARSSDVFVLLHGFGATSYTWRHWLPTLDAHGRSLLVDLKGFGASTKPEDDRYGPHDQCALVDDLVRAEDAEHVTLVGHSYGGGVALLTAMAMKDRGDARLRRLVLVSPASYPQKLPPFVTLARYPRTSRALLWLFGARRVIRNAFRWIVVDPSVVTEDAVRAYAAPLRTRAGAAAMLEAARRVVPDDLREVTSRFGSIEAPTLLMWGDRDRVVPLANGRRLAREMPDARLEVIEACGHAPQEEHPQRTAEILERFLAGS